MLGDGGAGSADLVRTRLQEAAEGIDAYRQTARRRGPRGSSRARQGRDGSRPGRGRQAAGGGGRADRVGQGSREVDDGLRAAALCGLILSSAALGYVAVRRRREHRASQALLEGVLENAPIGLGFLDPSLRIRHVNQALARMSEKALSAVPGMSIWDVIPQLRATLEPRIAQVVGGRRTVGQGRSRGRQHHPARADPATTRSTSIRCAGPTRREATKASAW